MEIVHTIAKNIVCLHECYPYEIKERIIKMILISSASHSRYIFKSPN